MKKVLLISILLVFLYEIESLENIRIPGKVVQDFAKGSSTLRAGVGKVDATLPIGVPLAGYNHGPRRVPFWPIPDPKKYTTWMEPNVGARNPMWVKAIVIDNGSERIAFVTLDAIGADGSVADLSYLIAREMGFNVSRENVIYSGSHTHSGPGAISPFFLWAIAPATDLLVPEIQTMYATFIAQAMMQAEQTLQPAAMDIGIGQLIGLTRNRRGPNPWVQPDSIDPNLGVIRIDTLSGQPIATVWNYATHGTCYGPDNMKFSSDIAGASCEAIEKEVGGVALFINADAGDIDPTDETCSCNKDLCTFNGAAKFAQAVKKVRTGLQPTSDVTIRIKSSIIPFGETQMNLTLARLDNCTTGGFLDICGICAVLRCDANLRFPESWVEENPRFTALNFGIRGKNTVMVTIPGEPLLELGWMIRNDTLDLGFDQTFLLGYSNNHMGYFATPNEYEWGGYESLLTMWGENTALLVRQGCKKMASAVKN